VGYLGNFRKLCFVERGVRRHDANRGVRDRLGRFQNSVATANLCLRIDECFTVVAPRSSDYFSGFRIEDITERVHYEIPDGKKRAASPKQSIHETRKTTRGWPTSPRSPSTS
jgi:hypothetical protein